MNHVRRGAVLLSLVAITSLVSACSGEGSSSSASARLALRNDTGSAASTQSFGRGGQGGGLGLQGGGATLSSAIAVSHFAMRLSKVYVVTDVDPATQENVGDVGMIWQSPHCSASGECDYFELARPTAEVLADLGSQDLPIRPGTYQYARIEFCQGGPQGPNVEWQADGMSASHAFTLGMCGVTSAKLPQPLVVAAGDHVTVSLGYDLAGSTAVGAVTPESPATTPALTAPDGHGIGYNDCAPDTDTTKKTCFDVPSFQPSASK